MRRRSSCRQFLSTLEEREMVMVMAVFRPVYYGIFGLSNKRHHQWREAARAFGSRTYVVSIGALSRNHVEK